MMKNIIHILALILFMISCQNPYGTDPDIIVIPIDEKKQNLDFELRIFEFHEDNKGQWTYYWDDDFYSISHEFTYNSNNNPTLLSVNLIVEENFPKKKKDSLDIFVDKIEVEMKNIPFKAGYLNFGNNIPSVKAYITFVDKLKNKTTRIVVKQDDTYAWVQKTRPYTEIVFNLENHSSIYTGLKGINLDYDFYK